MKSLVLALLSALAFVCATPARAQSGDDAPSWDLSHGTLRVSDDGRFLVHADGAPFFYMADTNWELMSRARREDAERLLETRRRQGFTVVTAPVTGIMDDFDRDRALTRANVYGDLAFAGRDFARPIVTRGVDPNDARQYDYWDHVDAIIDIAEAKGMHVALLPAWRVYFELGYLNERNARAYGRFLGERFGSRRNVVWVLGGDISLDQVEDLSLLEEWETGAKGVWRRIRNWPDRRPVTARVFRELAAGLREGEAFRHLMTYHPSHGRSSAEWFHGEDWLDFHMFQSGHVAFDIANYDLVAAAYGRTPPKPVMDGEAAYEDHAVGHNPARGWFGESDVRQRAYWSLFAGAHGHAYGARGVWQMYEPGRAPHRALRYYWYDAMNLPGAWNMRHVRDLMTSRPMPGRMPDQSLVRASLEGAARIVATRGDGYAFIYTPTGAEIDVALTRLAARSVIAWWFDPRTGAAARIGAFDGASARSFDPPGEPGLGNDWVLVLDDAARGFPPPGAGQTITTPSQLEPGQAPERPPQRQGAAPTQNAAVADAEGDAAFPKWAAAGVLLAAAAAGAVVALRRRARSASSSS